MKYDTMDIAYVTFLIFLALFILVSGAIFYRLVSVKVELDNSKNASVMFSDIQIKDMSYSACNRLNITQCPSVGKLTWHEARLAGNRSFVCNNTIQVNGYLYCKIEDIKVG
jgi:hypothetical protein